MENKNISITRLISRFRWKISLTLFLVLSESALALLFPLFIGFAINGLLEDSLQGIYQLAGLGVAALIVGSGRRFYDTRAYSDIYVKISDEVVAREQAEGRSISMISARASLLTEFVEFLENSMPMILESLIGVVGILIIIFGLYISVFWASIALLMLVFAVYWISAKANFRFNEGFNNQLEEQVNVLESRERGLIRRHFRTVADWNIKLSDLETWNYAAIWLGIIALLVYSPIAVIGSGVLNYGLIFSALMYVFQYVDNLVTLPFFIQQIIRLQEISTRLNSA